jgi:hypothetical protein
MDNYFSMSRITSLAVLIALTALTACSSAPTIKTEKFTRPQTVAFVESPAMRNAALITAAVYVPTFHFSPAADYFYLQDPALTAAGEPFPTDYRGTEAATVVSVAALTKVAPFNSGNTAAQVGTAFLVGALIDASAADTQKKAANFHEEVLKQIPGLDLRAEFSSALQKSLNGKGIRTFVVKDSINAPVRLRWAAEGVNTNQNPTAATNLPTVDADLLVQYSPLAIYIAPGPLNNYRVRATVGVALYNGRTKEYLGHQTFAFDPKAWDNEYTTFSELSKNIDKVVAAERTALLSLVPVITEVISNESRAAK